MFSNILARILITGLIVASAFTVASVAMPPAAVATPVAAANPVSDSSGAELTHDLDGVEMTYTYSDGGTYNIKYTPAGVKYRYVSGDAPELWWGPFPYKAFRTENGEYFLGWYEKGYGDQITQLVNLKTKKLLGSGIIIKNSKTLEHFQSAVIEKVVMPKKLRP